MISTIIQAFFKLKFCPIWVSKKKKQQRIYDLLNAETNPQNFQNNWSFFMA